MSYKWRRTSRNTFLKRFLEDISPFCGATDITVLDFWWCLLWVSKPEWVTLFALGGGIYVTWPLRFTSGVIPADLLVASMAAEPLPSIYLQAGISGAQNWDVSYHHCLTVWDQADALPTELCRLGTSRHTWLGGIVINFKKCFQKICCFVFHDFVNDYWLNNLMFFRVE